MVRWIILAALLAATIGGARAQSEPSDREIDTICEKQFPDFFGDYFKRDRCVSDAKAKRAVAVKDRKEKERLAAREENARTCIANDLPRLEGILAKMRDQAKEKNSIGEVQAIVESALDQKAQILPSNENIKEKVLIATLPPKCDTEFYFLINVRMTEGGDLRYLRVWTEKPPKGYLGGATLAAFAVDWEKERLALAAAQRQQQIRILEAATMKNVSLVNLEAKCVPLFSSASCRQVKFSFGVLNKSQTPIYTASFGWNFLLDTMADCPQQLVSKKTERIPTYGTSQILIGPNETRWFSVDSEILPDMIKVLPKWCFRITQVTVTQAPYCH